MYKDYKVLCIIGKAGAGKDTIARYLTTNFSDVFSPVISFTSRPMREREIDGKDYFFTTKSNFILKIKTGEMLEWTYFNDWYYGTTEQSFNKDKINICVCNPAGASSLKKLGFDVRVIYINVTDKERLIRQLTREDNPDVSEIIRRYSADEKDFQNTKYHIEVYNENRKVYEVAQDIVCWLGPNGQMWINHL